MALSALAWSGLPAFVLVIECRMYYFSFVLLVDESLKQSTAISVRDYVRGIYILTNWILSNETIHKRVQIAYFKDLNLTDAKKIGSKKLKSTVLIHLENFSLFDTWVCNLLQYPIIAYSQMVGRLRPRPRTPKEVKNVAIDRHFGFAFEKISFRKITWLSWSHRFRKPPFLKCFPSTPKGWARYFQFLRLFQNLRRFRDG